MQTSCKTSEEMSTNSLHSLSARVPYSLISQKLPDAGEAGKFTCKPQKNKNSKNGKMNSCFLRAVWDFP